MGRNRLALILVATVLGAFVLSLVAAATRFAYSRRLRRREAGKVPWVWQQNTVTPVPAWLQSASGRTYGSKPQRKIKGSDDHVSYGPTPPSVSRVPTSLSDAGQRQRRAGEGTLLSARSRPSAGHGNDVPPARERDAERGLPEPVGEAESSRPLLPAWYGRARAEAGPSQIPRPAPAHVRVHTQVSSSRPTLPPRPRDLTDTPSVDEPPTPLAKDAAIRERASRRARPVQAVRFVSPGAGSEKREAASEGTAIH